MSSNSMQSTLPKTFTTKLNNLLNLLHKASDIEVENQLIICHKIISELFCKDERILIKLNKQKLRLLAYEIILFSFQHFNENKKDDYNNIQALFNNNKLLTYLVSIKDMLGSMEEYLKNLSLSDGRGQSISFKRSLNTELVNKFSGGMDKIVELIEQFEILKLRQDQKKYREQTSNKNQQAQLLLQQMQSIIAKKDKRISELSNLLSKSSSQVLKSQSLIQQLQTLLHKTSEKCQALQMQVSNFKDQSVNLKTEIENYKKKIRILQQPSQVKQIGIQTISKQNNICVEPEGQQRVEWVGNRTTGSLRVVKKDSLRSMGGNDPTATCSLKSLPKSQTTSINMQKQRKRSDFEDLFVMLMCQAATIEEML